jgi:hypothetical protein
MPGKFKLIFSDFLRSAKKLWLEMMGGMFLAMAAMFSWNTFSTYRSQSAHILTEHAADTDGSIVGSLHGIVASWKTMALFSVLLLLFSLQSFWKARNIR